MKSSQFTPKTKEQYDDDDMVYIDIQKRTVVGLVEWTKDGDVKPLEQSFDSAQDNEDMEEKEQKKGKGKGRRRVRTYPWGTYRTMKKLYKVEGKILEQKPMIPLDEAIEKSMSEPYWD